MKEAVASTRFFGGCNPEPLATRPLGISAVSAFGKAEKLGTEQYAGPKVKNRLFEIMYEFYDYLQDQIALEYWRGYNDHREKAKETE